MAMEHQRRWKSAGPPPPALLLDTVTPSDVCGCACCCTRLGLIANLQPASLIQHETNPDRIRFHVIQDPASERPGRRPVDHSSQAASRDWPLASVSRQQLAKRHDSRVCDILHCTGWHSGIYATRQPNCNNQRRRSTERHTPPASQREKVARCCRQLRRVRGGSRLRRRFQIQNLAGFDSGPFTPASPPIDKAPAASCRQQRSRT